MRSKHKKYKNFTNYFESCYGNSKWNHTLNHISVYNSGLPSLSKSRPANASSNWSDDRKLSDNWGIHFNTESFLFSRLFILSVWKEPES